MKLVEQAEEDWKLKLPVPLSPHIHSWFVPGCLEKVIESILHTYVLSLFTTSALRRMQQLRVNIAIKTNRQLSSFIPGRNKQVWGTQTLQETRSVHVLMIAHPWSELGDFSLFFFFFSLRTRDCILLWCFSNRFSKGLWLIWHSEDTPTIPVKHTLFSFCLLQLCLNMSITPLYQWNTESVLPEH